MMSYTMPCTSLWDSGGHVDAFHVAVDADHRRQPGGQVQVRSLVLDGESEQLRNIYGHAPRRCAPSSGAYARCSRALRAAGHDLDTLSMGMSDDLEMAIAEGSTMVRVGTALFGARPAAAP
jgi:hypothetical protein